MVGSCKFAFELRQYNSIWSARLDALEELLQAEDAAAVAPPVPKGKSP
jgi:hypothetical protein